MFYCCSVNSSVDWVLERVHTDAPVSLVTTFPTLQLTINISTALSSRLQPLTKATAITRAQIPFNAFSASLVAIHAWMIRRVSLR